MRTTVGPLPSAVYWRRRAVVLGALLLGIIVLFVSCSGGEEKSPRTTNAASRLPTPAPGESSAAPSPDASLLESIPPGGQGTVGGGVQSPPPDEDDGPLPSTSASPAPNPVGGVNALPADGACADAEMSVTPVPARTTVRRGEPVDFRLKIKNNSNRTCKRDVGADMQELYLQSGVERVWSSDACSTVKGNDVRSLRPAEEREYLVTWNGRQSGQCASGQPSGPHPAAGQYELRARLGTVVSDPVTVSVTA